MSIIGVLAWLPVAFYYLRPYVSKSVLKFFFTDNIEIGYTTQGPVFNIEAAFYSDVNKSLISNITILLKKEQHKKGELKWCQMTDSIVKIASSTEQYKQQIISAALLTIETNERLQYKIDFKEPAFIKMYDQQIQHLNSRYLTNDIASELETSEEYKNFISVFENGFIWEAGSYDALITIYVDNNKQQYTKNISFALNEADIMLLEQNVAICKELCYKEYINKRKNVSTNWQWINKMIE